jgi:hypothetical protein
MAKYPKKKLFDGLVTETKKKVRENYLSLVRKKKE